MVQKRGGHSAITLANRTVLLAGGGTGDGSVTSNTAEIYNPVTDSFSAVGTDVSDSRIGTSRQFGEVVEGFVLRT